MNKVDSRVNVLSDREIKLIHESTLDILENVGLKVPHSKWLDIAEEAGACIDREKQIVKIPNRIMEHVIETNREKTKKNSNVQIPNRLYGHISTQVQLVDYKSSTRRTGLMEDIYRGITLVEHLENIKECNAIVIPHDVEYNISDIVSFQAIYKYSTKPGGTYILSPISAKYIAQMANVMGLKINYLFETVSPLQFRDEVLEIALEFIKHGQGLSMAPMVMAGATGPVTIAGMLTMQNAEVLASLFLIYAATRKYVKYEVGGHALDMQTALCSFGTPNQALIGMSVAQLGRYYGLETRSNSGLTDSLRPDFQAGFEKALTATYSCLAGTIDIGCQGIVGADQGNSFEQLVLDNEWLSAYNYIQKGIEVTEETIALDVIKNVGIGGHYLMEGHTLEHMNNNYLPSKVLNKDAYDTWVSKGSKDSLQKAHEKVEDIFSHGICEELAIEKNKADEIDYIVKCAKEEINSI
ncbi:trimethylamine methyltransferase MttB [Vallitalea longa]|uniref:Trimethylamine methyltransferase MttB n=1 Tax=Vallitalea longa TaxID=2936439 RepID=A0A9W5Y7A6_9FIRM|nr:trimethylamine methyltransferase family protein [Vallitalea longa]GKX27952.1 trimethylamine methyltransferase MttB [Vallitalea longa]